MDTLGDALRVPGLGRSGVAPDGDGDDVSATIGGGVSGVGGASLAGVGGGNATGGGRVSGGSSGSGVGELRGRGGVAPGPRKAGAGPRHQQSEEEDDSDDDEDEDEGWDDGGEVAKALAGKVATNGVVAGGGSFGVPAAMHVVQVGWSVICVLQILFLEYPAQRCCSSSFVQYCLNSTLFCNSIRYPF